MLLDDAIKIRAAKKLKDDQKSVAVPGIMTTEKGVKKVSVSLSNDGLKIEEDLSAQMKEIKKKPKTRKPRKTKAKKGK